MEKIEYNDKELTDFRRGIYGHGGLEDLKKSYSYSNQEDIDEIFEIIEHMVFSSLVVQKLNEYENTIDEENEKNIKFYSDFIKSIEGLSFEKGGFKLVNVNRKFIIMKYINYLKN